jgi:hypothetical protein
MAEIRTYVPIIIHLVGILVFWSGVGLGIANSLWYLLLLPLGCVIILHSFFDTTHLRKCLDAFWDCKW